MATQAQTRFTPGPWEALGLAIYHSNHVPLARVASNYLSDTSEDPEWNEASGINEKEAVENAFLLAAAPDLYAALERLVAAVTEDGECPGCGDADGIHNTECAYIAAEAALAHARGEV